MGGSSPQAIACGGSGHPVDSTLGAELGRVANAEAGTFPFHPGIRQPQVEGSIGPEVLDPDSAEETPVIFVVGIEASRDAAGTTPTGVRDVEPYKALGKVEPNATHFSILAKWRGNRDILFLAGRACIATEEVEAIRLADRRKIVVLVVDYIGALRLN